MTTVPSGEMSLRSVNSAEVPSKIVTVAGELVMLKVAGSSAPTTPLSVLVTVLPAAKSTSPSLMGPMVGTSFSIVTDAPASITTRSPSKSVAANTEARLRAIVSASPPPVASGT